MVLVRYVAQGVRVPSQPRVGPLFLGLGTVAVSAAVTRHVFKSKYPVIDKRDLLPFLVGFLGMMVGSALQKTPASVWSPLIDLGSFAVGTSLIAATKPGSWPRIVGNLQVGIHTAQVVSYAMSHE